MGYFSSLHAELEDAGIDVDRLFPTPPKTKKVEKKVKNPCVQCFSSEGTRGGGYCLWCWCDPKHYWNW